MSVPSVSVLESRRFDGYVERRPRRRGRGWLVRRALLTADAASLVLAYVFAKLVASGGVVEKPWLEVALLIVMLPVWIVTAKLCGLYDRDEERVEHSTVDEVVGVFQLVTVGAWFFFVATWLARTDQPHVPRLLAFWLLAALLVPTTRGLARGAARRSSAYRQNTIVVGAGHIGQLVARKLLQHPEYRLNLVGFVDPRPRRRRPELADVALVGAAEHLAEVVEELDIERVIIAFSDLSHDDLVDVVRQLRRLDLQIDVVPRLFEVIGPRATIHSFEGLALVGLPPAALTPSSRLLKRAMDYVVALAMLLVLAPFMAVIALCIRLDSPGPVLFRQKRLGYHMVPFTVLKFRTMRAGTDPDAHRRYIEHTMTTDASPNANGLYKLDRADSVTRVGRLLRKTSLDELPQLFNVIAGEMSLVGPRPCLDYEARQFDEHHFERFLVPPGITGLWQVTARARATFGEALDMDVEYVRGWSLSLDVRLLLKTPFSLVQMKATA